MVLPGVEKATAAQQVPAVRARPTPAVLAHLVSLMAGFVVLLYANRDQWFVGDEWAFLGHRGLVGADRGLFEPHNEHWSTVPILVYRALYTAFGVHSYLPYVLVLVLLHLAVAHLLWRVLRRCGVDPGVATAMVCVFVLLGAGYENLLWAFQIGFVGSVACGLGALLLADHDGPFGRRDVAASAVLVLGLTFSGIGVTMAMVTGLAVLLRRGLRPAVLTVAGPGLVYLGWLAWAGKEGLSSHPRSLDGLFQYPDYVWRGLSVTFERTLGIPGVGPVMIVGLAGWLLRRGRWASGPMAPAFAGAMGAVTLFLILAVGRTALGVEQANASRYTYITMALLLPALGLVVNEVSEGLGAGRLVVWALVGLVVLHNVGLLRRELRDQVDVEQRLKARVLSAADLVATGAVVLEGRPEPATSPDITVDDLRTMSRDGKVPVGQPGPPEDRLAVRSALQVAMSDTGLGSAGAPPRILRVVGATQAVEAPGCVTFTPVAPGPEVQLSADQPLSVRVRSSSGGEIRVILVVAGPEPVTGPPRTFALEADRSRYLNVVAGVDAAAVGIPSTGPTEVCGLAG